MKNFWRYFGPVAAVVLVGWVAWWSFMAFSPAAPTGDIFSGINALFSGLALAGVVTAVILQGQELHLQRAELQLTREELKRAADAHTAAAKALGDQIEMQLKAAELKTVSALLDSVNSQLAPGGAVRGAELDMLQKARGRYHKRLHDLLREMGRSIDDTTAPTESEHYIA